MRFTSLKSISRKVAATKLRFAVMKPKVTFLEFDFPRVVLIEKSIKILELTAWTAGITASIKQLGKLTEVLPYTEVNLSIWSICYAAVCSCIESLLHTREAKPRENEMNSRGMNKRQHNVFKPREKNSEWKIEKIWMKIHLLHTIYCTPFIAHYLLRSLEGDIYCTLHLLHSFMVLTSGLKHDYTEIVHYQLMLTSARDRVTSQSLFKDQSLMVINRSLFW